MRVYIPTILIVSILALAYDFINIDLSVREKNKFKPLSMLLVILITLLLIFVSGFRYNVGADYMTYSRNYETYRANIWTSIKTFDEPGIKVIAYFSDLLDGDYSMLFLIASIITIGLSVYAIYKTADWFLMSILLYVFVGSWTGSFNGVRQYLAMAIFFYGHKYILEKNFKSYLLIIALAASFHISALVLLPIYFIKLDMLTNRQIITIFFIASAGVLLTDKLLKVMDIVITSLRGSGFIPGDMGYVTREVNLMRIMVTIAPMLLYMAVPDKKNYKADDFFYIKLLLINSIIYTLSYKSAYIARFAIYTNIYTVIGLPIIVKGYRKKERYILLFIILILYALFWYTDIKKDPTTYNYQWIFNR